jgi:hypothetical protein
MEKKSLQFFFILIQRHQRAYQGRKHPTARVKAYGSIPVGNCWNMEAAGSHRKYPETFRPKYCFHVPAISGVFLQALPTFRPVSVKSACFLRPEPLT